MENATHLAGVSSEMYERKWERFYVRRPARIMAVNPGLSGITMRSCEVLDISQGGAGLEITTTIGLSKHYYLQIIGLADRIGCAEAYRNGNRVGVRFIAPIPEAMLHRIVRADFMLGDNLRPPVNRPNIAYQNRPLR
ncbi:PilZ domain-containing protein [Peteryoungia desertarenae]|uniref:PilZ domain-containing protein n=1 Tax=Peteryoungia desertarenae TaxID=1813451 RepID=A0ABX6QNR6_9HYPH|nr:PilZ domain-containing protein [Peteryoungia desertarenae]QLF69922.1 PilZ domain-containing protein [Peteryoungia desertarenae]